MKNKLTAAFFLIATMVLMASCATSRKYGCPMVQVKAQSNNS
ncbi:MAG TPA: hypothetical protein VFX58_16025 [Chitinophagaceae bacterium]|nr:hypothetical protein [Chitinophagaceae bacterium]